MFPRLFVQSCFAAILAASLHAAPVINEIMYKPAGVPEVPAQEWVEILNPDPASVDISGWAFSKGVNFTFPQGTTIPAGGYLVVAANVTAFQAANPGFAGTVVGNWTGRLSNSGEEIQLDDATGAKVNDVAYAPDGDWAVRGRQVVTFAHKGWEWTSPADGGGSSLELRNPALGTGSGQNWGASTIAGGTPGAANSVVSGDVAPLIKDPKHKPEIPTSTEAVTISCNLEDEAAATATLHWRLSVASPGAFATLPMTDIDGDGDVEATIPAQANLAIVEWYISATDGAQTRTWPAPARTSDVGVLPETFGQATNALFQVDNSYSPAATFLIPADNPIYRMILPVPERNELVQLQTTNGQQESDASFNATFISHDGTGVKTRYQCGVRNRGMGSALGPPNNYHVEFLDAERWNGRSSFGLNCRFGYAQVLGQALMARAGLATQDAAAVKVRLNGADLSEPGVVSATIGRMYGRYARLEGRGGDWAEHHYPNDPDGNFYRLDDHTYPIGDIRSGEFRDEGANPADYADTFVKETNKDANDYSDLINFSKIVSAPVTGGTASQAAISDADYPAAVAAVLDLDNFYRFIATDTLIGNVEGGLTSGRGDDASIYFGVLDPRMKFIPHDLDTIFDIGDTVSAGTRDIFSYDGGTAPGTGVSGLTRLFNHPQLVPRYYAALLDALNTWYNSATIDPIVDQIMVGWVPLTEAVPVANRNRCISEIKAYVAIRRASVLGMIQQTNSLTTTVAGTDTAEGYRRTLDGSATFSGTFNVAKTYSITVNGVAAVANYRTRTSPTATAGTWSLAVPAGGGAVLHPGLNRVNVQFWDAPGGTGKVLQTFAVDVLFQPNTATYTNVSGTLSAGSLRLTAPATYIPGKPFLVRAEVLNGAGALDRTAWDGTVNLSSSVGGLGLPAIPLYNGTGSAVVTLGGGTGGASTQLVAPGKTAQAPNAAAPSWKWLDSQLTAPTADWKSAPGFNDSTWASGLAEFGCGETDQRTTVTTPATGRPTYYFRHKFNVADKSIFGSLTLNVVYDDGIAVYLNGVELKRLNLAAAAAHADFALSARSGTLENSIESYTVSAADLLNGENLIAVEIHNHSTTTDISYDLELLGNPPAADPGNLTLTGNFTAPGANFTAQRALTSLTAAPAITTASGALPAGLTTWTGVVQVTGDVTVPAGSTLEIAPGTHVLVDGDATPGSTAGRRIVVNGALNSLGTLAQPVAITTTNPTDRWGGLVFSGAQPSALNYTLLNHAGHTTGVGHTGRGPMIRLTGSSLNLHDSVVADGPAKAIYASGTCDLNIRRSLIERMITGPELEDGTALLIEDSNIQRILPDYRESNAAAPDDEDCLYVHNGSGRSVVIRRAVFARCGDDVFDCLGGPIIVEDSILREGWDKGMSLLNNDLTITRTQIIKCDKAIVPKSQNVDTRTVLATNVTIVSENHDTSQSPWGYAVAPSNPDPDTPSTGFYTQNKSGQSNAGATLSIIAKNCIVQAQSPVLIDAPYSSLNTVVTYSNLTLLDNSAFAWPGTGNIGADPLFAGAVAGDYHIGAGSPSRDTGDPAMTDTDGSRIDMGALPYGGSVASGGSITWTGGGGPYRITANATVPAGTTLNIQPGTAIYFDPGTRLTVNGRVLAQGTAGARITFSHVPGAIAAGDCDPIKNGVQTGPPKWGGVRVYDSMAQESVFRYCDFINAQGTSINAPENFGSLGFIRSWGWVDHCTFAGTHLRMCYGRNSKMTVTHNVFPDMFIPDAVLGRIEAPTDFITAADNNMEPLKVEYPTTDTEVTGSPLFANGQPVGGHFRVYYNDFNGNRGHNDVFDADSGRWGQAGQFMLDCRYNHFHGLSGDEHVDLGGDAYIASNIFENATKDQWVSAFGTDLGYSNAISSGDKGTGTTIMVVRNLFFDLDHAINCKASTATIFEHNTVANFHTDYTYTPSTPDQDVKIAPVNFFVPEDGSNPTYGDGAYMGFNLVSNVPRLFSGADTRKINGTTLVNDVTTKIEFNHNLLDQLGTPDIGPNHPNGVFGGTYGPNTPGAPGFVNAVGKNYALLPESLARGTTVHGFDYGATIAEWAYVVGGPAEGGSTAATTAGFTIGGPGVVAYKWRLDGGAWSAPVQIGSGGVLPRATPTIRQATLNLGSLAAGTHMLEVLGQDMAGNWQDADPARTLEGIPQALPTKRIWTVDPAFVAVRLSEILADSTTTADTVEVQNISAGAVDMTGWSLTDDPALPNKFPLSGVAAAGAYVAYTSPAFGLDKDGDRLYLYQGAVLRDSVIFGHQVTGTSLVRHPATGAWTLGTPTLGAVNTTIPVGDYSGVRITEWLASGGARYEDDWIELQNTAASPALLTGLRITDNQAGNSGAFTFPALSFLGANSYLRLIADGTNVPGRLPFSLDAEREQLWLLGADGAPLDTVLFYPQTTDFSMGRDPATGEYTFYELPTRGFANGTSDPAYVNALAMLRGLRITEIMYNAVGGSDYDYLELRNTGADAFDLNGAKFVEGITFAFGSLTMNPGDTVVLVKHSVRFRNRYGLVPVIAGTYGGQLDNGGEKLAIQLPPPFDANVLTFSYNDTWYPSSDGLGRSIVVPNSTLAPRLWDDKDTWSASGGEGGDPAGAAPRTDTFAGWMAGNVVLAVGHDADRDTASGIVEFVLGMNPNNARGLNGIAGLPVAGVAPNGHATLTFVVPENALAAQGHGFADTTVAVQAADSLTGPWTTIATKTFAADWTGTATVGTPTGGFVTVTIEDSLPHGTNRFLRFSASWIP